MEKQIQLFIRPFSEADPEIQKLVKKSPNGFARKGLTEYLLITDHIYSCEMQEDGCSLLNLIQPKETDDYGSEAFAWKTALKGMPDQDLISKYDIPDNAPRCILLFCPIQNGDHAILREIIPLDGTDRLVPMDSGETVLIFHMDKRSADDVMEYAAAVAETLESEAGITCYIGIGRMAESLSQLAVSYAEARTAVETGIQYKKNGRVFAFDRLALERLASLIPYDHALRFRNEMIPVQAEKALTEETLETIRVFFRNDLNLSTTARQLFIHRNTLLYRMEKIRKLTGLDLRRFEDAVVFRFLLMISDNTDKQ